MRERAIFISGNYESNLQAIADVQAVLPEQILFIQPHGGRRIAYLRGNPPSVDDPVTLYCSISNEMNRVHFAAQVVGWDDKEELSPQKREAIDKVIGALQPGDGRVYDVGCNLIHIRRMVRVEPPFSVAELVKISDNEPLSPNKYTAGFSYVRPLGDDAGDAGDAE